MSKVLSMLAVAGLGPIEDALSCSPNVCNAYGQQLIGYDDDDVELAGYGMNIAGEDDDELDMIIGAVAQKVQQRRQAQRAQAVQLQRPVRVLQRVQNTQLRRYPLGLGATAIAAGATAVISANPQLPFQVNRLVTPSTGLLIDNLSVGTASQFVAAGAVPVEVFSPDAVDVDLKGDTAVPGVAVQITVSNPTAGSLTFRGAIIGQVAQ